MKKNMPIRYELKNGNGGAVSPTIQFIPNGKLTYLWVGDDSAYGQFFGALGGPKTLEKFARQLLAALNLKKRRTR